MAAQTDKLVAHVNGIPAGYLSPSPDSPKYVFTYFPEAPSDAFVSLTMPVRAESYVWQEGLHPIFQMNLPEGYLFQHIRDFFPKQEITPMHLLALMGNNGIGRLGYQLPGEPSSTYPTVINKADLLSSGNGPALFSPDSRS